MINIFIDSSGSMFEDEKISIVKNYLYTFLKILKHYHIFYFIDEEKDFIIIDEIRKIKYSKDIDVDKIINIINSDSSEDKYLFITDGIFEIENLNIINKKNFYIVYVGKDADLYNIYQICQESNIYSMNNCIKLANLLNR